MWRPAGSSVPQGRLLKRPQGKQTSAARSSGLSLRLGASGRTPRRWADEQTNQRTISFTLRNRHRNAQLVDRSNGKKRPARVGNSPLGSHTRSTRARSSQASGRNRESHAAFRRAAPVRVRRGWLLAQPGPALLKLICPVRTDTT